MAVARMFQVRPGVFAGIAVLITALMVALVTIPQTLSRHARLDVLRDHVGEVARLAASQVDGTLHRRLLEGDSTSLEERQRALAPLLHLHAAWPEATYLYTMGARDGQAFFVLDTAQDETFARQRGLKPSGFLEPFRLRAEYASDWLDQLAAGRTFVTPTFQQDDYGYFLTGHATIHDGSGRAAGFVGVDFDMDYYLGEERRFRNIEIASVVGAILLSLILAYVCARYHFAQQAEVREHYETSLRDSLTGLPNRRGALVAIEAALRQNGPLSHAALLVDIDHFKMINDTHGHAAGDAVIQTLASSLRACSRPGDVAARLGGDEFLIFVPGADRAIAEQLADTLLTVVRSTAQGPLPFEVSIGISVESAAEATFDGLYRRADTALYRAKSDGKNRYVVGELGAGVDPAPLGA